MGVLEGSHKVSNMEKVCVAHTEAENIPTGGVVLIESECLDSHLGLCESCSESWDFSTVCPPRGYGPENLSLALHVRVHGFDSNYQPPALLSQLFSSIYKSN